MILYNLFIWDGQPLSRTLSAHQAVTSARAPAA